MYENKIIVMARYEDGSDSKESYKLIDKLFSAGDFYIFIPRVRKLDNEDVIYFTIRTTINGRKDNYKFKSFDVVEDFIRELFCD